MKTLTKLTLIFMSLLLTINCTLLTASSYAEIPHLINFQGKLADSDGKPITGTRDITFRIYNVESGGSSIWDETHKSVTIDKGIFNVQIGSTKDLNLLFDVPYWLGIRVGTDAEMTPRQRITSAGYAFRAQDANQAQNADTTDGIHASTTPEANKLLALDSSAKLPSSALGLKVYDSGWFACTTGGTYLKTHGLGTTKMLCVLYFATDSSGSNMVMVTDYYGNENDGGQVKSITTTTLTVQAASDYVTAIFESSGRYTMYSSGYYRVVALALE